MPERKRTPLGELVHHYRTHYPDGKGNKALSFKQAAIKTGVSHTLLNRIELGKVNYRNILTSIFAIIGGLGIPENEFFEAAMKSRPPQNQSGGMDGEAKS